MRQEVCQSLRGSVNTWQHNLQAKWGDPAVYAAQETERLRQDARVVYDLNRRNSELLSEAYQQRATKQRDTHNTRMDTLKRRGYRGAGTPPESRAAKAPRTAPPPVRPRRAPSAAADGPPGSDPAR